MPSKLSDSIRSRLPVVCRLRGHDFRLASTKREGDDVTVEERTCPCGTKLVRRLVTVHGVCPHCGGRVTYDPDRPKTYVGTDTYCEEAYGEWVCKDCYQTGEEDFSGDFIGIEEHLVVSGRPK